ncbi:MAG: helix-turn-helix domain-containing protein [Candidatus Sulfotelmatobacter sp.]
MVFVKYPHRETRQAFVRISDRNAVLSLRPEQSWSQQRSAERKRRPAANGQDRLKVLHEVRQGHITKKQAAVELGLSVQWVCQLLSRWRAGGDSALRHGLLGPSVEPQNAGSAETASRGTTSHI